jgi:hypothetical protein
MNQDFKGMRQGHNKRSRGRGHNPNNAGGGGGGGGGPNNNNNRGPRPPNRMQSFDSNGPSVKIRGNAYQVFERYIALAREASTSGDRIAAENLYQHAEHYYRIMQANGDGQNMGPPRPMTPADTEMNGMGSDDGYEQQGQPQQPQPQPHVQHTQPPPQPQPPQEAEDLDLPASLLAPRRQSDPNGDDRR